MYSSPNARQMVEAVTNSLVRNVLPGVASPSALREMEMCVALLKRAAQLIPVEQQILREECGEMRALFSALGSLVKEDGSQEAGRIQGRVRAMAVGGRTVMPPYDELLAWHRELSLALIPTLDDLHALDSKGVAIGAEGLAMVRGHLACRGARDFRTYLGTAPEAMVGRE